MELDLERLARRAVRIAKEEAPMRTGRLRDSITWIQYSSKSIRLLCKGIRYAPVVHEGSSNSRMIRVKNKKVMAWDPSNPFEMYHKVGRKFTMSRSSKAFATYVIQPPLKSNKFFKRTVQRLKQETTGIMQDLDINNYILKVLKAEATRLQIDMR